jgi:hypothetical protein
VLTWVNGRDAFAHSRWRMIGNWMTGSWDAEPLLWSVLLFGGSTLDFSLLPLCSSKSRSSLCLAAEGPLEALLPPPAIVAAVAGEAAVGSTEGLPEGELEVAAVLAGVLLQLVQSW